MMQFTPYGVAAVVGGVVGKKMYQLFTKIERTVTPLVPIPGVRLVRDAIVEERPIILAAEEIPLDNRFGNKVLVSEHEFVRTATIALSMARDQNNTKGFKASWWPILEGLAQEEVRKTLGVELNTQITRRVKVVFSTDPGHLVRYRVVWKQDSRRGLLEVNAGGGMYAVPYLVTFGLSHAIESIAGEVLHGETLR